MKTKRQAKIIEIISNTNVETQEQLLKALEEAGFTSTQATISRDIKELRIVKELTSLGTYRYSVSEKDAVVQGFAVGRVFPSYNGGFHLASAESEQQAGNHRQL